MHPNGIPYPFKRPFKGKSAALNALDDLAEERTKIERQQAALIAEWQDRTAIDGLSLSVFRQGAPVLRWRTARRVFGKQQYIELFGDAGRPLLDALPPAAIDFLVGFDSHRLLLNARSRAVHASLAAFEHYRVAIARLPTPGAAPCSEFARLP